MRLGRALSGHQRVSSLPHSGAQNHLAPVLTGAAAEHSPSCSAWRLNRYLYPHSAHKPAGVSGWSVRDTGKSTSWQESWLKRSKNLPWLQRGWSAPGQKLNGLWCWTGARAHRIRHENAPLSASPSPPTCTSGSARLLSMSTRLFLFPSSKCLLLITRESDPINNWLQINKHTLNIIRIYHLYI